MKQRTLPIFKFVKGSFVDAPSYRSGAPAPRRKAKRGYCRCSPPGFLRLQIFQLPKELRNIAAAQLLGGEVGQSGKTISIQVVKWFRNEESQAEVLGKNEVVKPCQGWFQKVPGLVQKHWVLTEEPSDIVRQCDPSALASEPGIS